MSGRFDWTRLGDWARELGLELTSDQTDLFSRWADHLAAAGRSLNLTSIGDPLQVARLHFLDSLSLWLVPQVRSSAPVVDVGSGAGFPGLAIKIIRPCAPIDLLEAIGKRARYLDRLVNDMGLDTVRVLHGRAEEIGRRRAARERYDLVVSRAVAPLPTLLEYCLPLCRVGGVVVAMKGPRAGEEVEHSRRAAEILGAGQPEAISLTLPGGDERRTLLVLKKQRATPRDYPRAPGRPARDPL